MWFMVMLVMQNLPIPHFHFIKKKNFFFILGNFDPENPRNIKSNWYGLANGDGILILPIRASSKVNLLNDDTYRWNCETVCHPLDK